MPNSVPYQPMAPAVVNKEVIGQGIMKSPMAALYPAYYKDVSHISEIDVYMVHYLFDIKDPSGAIQHASKKLLLSGTRTGGKSMFKDIKEARDTLNRWLEMNPEK